MSRQRGRRRRRPLFILTTKRTLFFGAMLLVLLGASLVKGSRPSAVSPGPLTGQVIYIDPGHGGIDPGACGNKWLEKDIVLKVALYLGVRLEKSGAKVVYSRTGDYDLETDEVDDTQARLRMIDSSGATIVLSIHCNAFTDPRERGAQTFYNESRNPRSKDLAAFIQAELAKETSTDREISARLDHFMLNYGDKPAVTVELGFLSNPEEEELLGTPSYQQKLAECIRRAIVAFVEASV
ncbi:MAG: N-acetylmuramoyl-L-alanine amidase family protein [Bacillota bacterium]|jgi:N-acetylmuramoyl-L-alanine amidase